MNRNPNCKLCALHKHAQHVCLMGDGSTPSNVMIVGEAPGDKEDQAGIPFVGPSGKLLRHNLDLCGLNDSYITNVAKCRPPGNREPSSSEMLTCVSEYLRREINEVCPKYFLLLGNVALWALTGRRGIMQVRGNLYRTLLGLVFPTIHPSAALRSKNNKETFLQDIELFSALTRAEADTFTPLPTQP